MPATSENALKINFRFHPIDEHVIPDTPIPKTLVTLAHAGDVDHADLLENALRAAAASGAVLQLEAGKTYALSRPANPGVAVRLDLNGATLAAPKGAVVASSTRLRFTAGDYFTTRLGAVSFEKRADWQIQAGDVLRFESDTVRFQIGGYRFGQYARVVSVVGNVVSINVPFHAVFRVDRLFVLEPLDHWLANGTIDISQAAAVSSGLPVSGVYLRGNRICVDRVRVIGGPEAGMGLQLEGMTVTCVDCHVSDVTNNAGHPSGGRTGYGIAPTGDVMTIVRPVLERCKHGISGGSRTYNNRILKVIDAVCLTPQGSHSRRNTDQSGVTTPLYQAAIDAHANLDHFEIVRPHFDTVNSCVAVRNGHAVITDPLFLTRGVTTLFRNDMLVVAYEAPVRHITIRGARIVTDVDFPLTGANYPTLLGIQSLGPASHDRIVIEGAEAEGPVPARLFWMPGSGTAATDAAVSLESLRASGIRGRWIAGIQINGSANSPLGRIGELVLDGDITLGTGSYGYAYGTLDVRWCAGVAKVTVRGTHDGAEHQVSGLGMIQLGASGSDPQSPPMLVDCRGARILAKGKAFVLASRSTVAPGPGYFQGAQVTHGAAGITDGPGIYVNVPSAPTEDWIFMGATILTGQPSLANGNNIRFVGATRFAPDGCVVNHDSPIFPANFGRAIHGLRSTGRNGRVAIRTLHSPNIFCDNLGQLFASSEPSSRDAVFAPGTIVWNGSITSGGTPGWVHLGAGQWRALANVLI